MMICLKVIGGYDNKIHLINIAAAKEKNQVQLSKLQSELQKLIDNLNVRIPLSGHAIGNTGDYSAPFNINGKTVISKDFDKAGYAEQVLDKLRKIANKQYENESSSIANNNYTPQIPSPTNDHILLHFFEKKPLKISEYEDISDTILACMIHHAMQNKAFLRQASYYLQPLVPRIMTINDLTTTYLTFNPPYTLGDAFFKGSKTFGIGNGFNKTQDNSHINDYYLNRGEFGVARLL